MRSFLDLRRTLKTRLDRLRQRAQAGMTTAEYAVGTLAACTQHTSQSLNRRSRT